MKVGSDLQYLRNGENVGKEKGLKCPTYATKRTEEGLINKLLDSYY